MKGDTKIQAALRDTMIKKGDNIYETPYIQKIKAQLCDTTKLLDIGCGTGHIIQTLSGHANVSVGMDISSAMLDIAKGNTRLCTGLLVQGDGLYLPFQDKTFDVVITRLADYSIKEAYRVLKKGGHFFEYGLGPHANKEIVEFFPDTIDKEAFFFPENIEKWKKEICSPIKDAGFSITSVDDYYEKEYYKSEDEVLDLIEMVPLVTDFDRKKDKKIVKKLAEKYTSEKGIEITWHYCIVEAQRL